MKYKIFAAFSRIVFFFGFLFISLPAESVSLDRLKIGGYIDLEYTKSSNEQGLGSGSDKQENGSFHQRHFNLLMEATVSDRLSVNGHIEFESGADIGGGSTDNGRVIVEWAFAEFLVTDYLKFRGGKLRTPYGFYNEIRDATPAFLSISIPAAVYSPTKVGLESDLIPKWNTGLNALGDIFITKDIFIDYSLYIGNGENTSRNVNEAKFDDNKDKAVGGRIQLNSSFNNILNTTLGFSFFNGDQAFTNPNPPGGVLNYEHAAYGVSASINIKNFNVLGEYFISKVQGTEINAYFIETSYAFKQRFTPYIIYSHLDPHIPGDPGYNTENDYFESVWLGINVKVIDGLFFKLEHQWNMRGDNNISVDKTITNYHQNFNVIKTAIVVAF